MGFQYDWSAPDLLRRLGFTSPVGKEALTRAEEENGLKLPPPLFEFLSLAADCPLLSTADIWTDKVGELRFLYAEIQEMIDMDREYWEKDPEKYKDNDYFRFWKLPKEEWGSVVPDYLLIGSDYGAGVMQYGIRREDLGENDPPMYMNHECDAVEDWRLWEDHISDFLLQTLCDALCCGEYASAERAMKKAGWTPRRLNPEDLPGLGADMTALLRQKSMYGADTKCGIGYDGTEKRLLAIRIDKGDKDRLDGMEYCFSR